MRDIHARYYWSTSVHALIAGHVYNSQPIILSSTWICTMQYAATCHSIIAQLISWIPWRDCSYINPFESWSKIIYQSIHRLLHSNTSFSFGVLRKLSWPCSDTSSYFSLSTFITRFYSEVCLRLDYMPLLRDWLETVTQTTHRNVAGRRWEEEERGCCTDCCCHRRRHYHKPWMLRSMITASVT